MKRFHTCLILIAVILISCQKDKGTSTSSSTTETSVHSVAAPPPTADFRISNVISPGNVWEALTLKFNNVSKDAESYYWDFGNGVTSTERNPSDISLAPCGFTYTISLTVKNKDGVSSTYSSPFFVLCSRGMGYGAHGQ